MKEIENKSTILNDINKSLGVDSNPAVEYLITMPYGLIKLPFGLGSNKNKLLNLFLCFAKQNAML